MEGNNEKVSFKTSLIVAAVSLAGVGLIKGCDAASAWMEARDRLQFQQATRYSLLRVCRPAVDAVVVKIQSGKVPTEPPGFQYRQQNNHRIQASYEDRAHVRYQELLTLQASLRNEQEGIENSNSATVICNEVAHQGGIALVEPSHPLRVISPDEEIRRAQAEGERALREWDQAQANMLETLGRRAVAHDIDTSGPSRVDVFHMKDGTITMCRTTVRNNAPATTCRDLRSR